MISANLPTLGLLKIKQFKNKGYDAIIFVHDFINKILSHYINEILNAIMCPEFGNSTTNL